jgi:hypothetical protein
MLIVLSWRIIALQSERTLQRPHTSKAVRCGQWPLHNYQLPHKLTGIERAEVLAIANSDEFCHLPSSQIVPRLVDQACPC